MCKIYVITNTINGKVYVGQTWKDIYKRLQEHSIKKDCRKIFYAIRKYGKEQFKVDLLAEASDQHEADELERFWISKLDSIKGGYNIRDGGSNGKLSPETKRKLSQAHQGKCDGEQNGFYGKRHTEETKLNYSKVRRGKKLSKEAKINISNAKIGEKNPAAKLNWEIVNKIREEYKNKTGPELAKIYGISVKYLYDIVSNRFWKEKQ